MTPAETGAVHDQALISRIADRDRSALAELYDAHARLLYGIVLGLLADTDDAEDTLQEVFVQIWRGARTYDPDLGSPRTWMIRLARNRAIDVLRSRRWRQRHQEVRLSDEPGDIHRQPDVAANSTWTSMVLRDQAGHVASALAQLPREQSALIELAFHLGYTHAEIAEQTGIPLGTVKTRIRNGLLRLRSQLGIIAEEG